MPALRAAAGGRSSLAGRAPARRTLAVGALLLAAGTALIALEPAWTRPLADFGFDAVQRLSPRTIESTPAIVVAIDEKSIAAVGRWPWPRTRLAALVDEIQRHRPAAIGLDIFMPEADPLSPERALAELWRGVAAAGQAPPTNDSLLAKALASAPTVLAVAGMPEPTGRPLRVAPVAIVGADDPAAVESRLSRHAGALGSVAELDAAASGWGLVSVDREGGVVRRLPLVGSVGGTLVPAFAIEMLRVAMGVPSVRLIAHESVPRAISVGDVVVPSEADGGARIHFSPRSAARFVSAVDVLERRIDGAALAQRVVIVGITGLGLGEYHATPLGDSMPGSEIHAQLVESVFDGTLVVRPRWASAAEATAFLVVGALLLWAVPARKQRYGAVILVAGLAVLAGLVFLAFRVPRLALDAAVPGAAIAVLFGTLLWMSLSDAARVRRTLERVLQTEREQAARMAGELDAARRVQTAMLPTAEVVQGDPRIDLAASMVPAREVGGDLYDFFRLDERRLFFIVGDVAGKGLSASIFMAVSKALVKSTTLRPHAADVGAIMSHANDEVSRDNPEMLFVTACAGVLDLDTGELRYCIAGHEPPFVLAPGAGVQRIADGGGPPLCVLPSFDYPEGRHRMLPGERLCIVSDGVTEAQDRDGRLFGSERVAGVLLETSDPRASSAAIVARLRAATRAFTGDAEAADDATLLVLRWNGPRADA